MFEYFSMANNYKERLIKNTIIKDAEIDTCKITDSDQPYETAVIHPSYNDNCWIVVEMYDTKEEAKEGHTRWVDVFSKGELPLELKDVSTCNISKIDIGRYIWM